MLAPLLVAVWIFPVSRCGVAHAEANWEASALLKTCARLGNANAQAYLGMLYWSAADGGGSEIDSGLSQDEARKRGWELLRRAAEKEGGSAAANEIGLAYLEGRHGLREDAAEARKWFGRATRAGDEIAPFNFARVYVHGRGVQADLETALTFLSISADRGYRPAQCYLQEWKQVSETAAKDTIMALGALLENDSRAQCLPNDAFSTFVRSSQARIDRALREAKSIYRGHNAALQTEARLRKAEIPEERACSVYADFFSELSRSSRVFLNPTTISYPSGDGMPRSFERETGEREFVSIGETQYERPVTEQFDFDTSAMAEAIVSDTIYSVKRCFSKAEMPVTFWDSTAERLYAKEASGSEETWPTVVEFALWSVSPVGFSADGEFALIYAEYVCGGLCGAGAFHLLERTDEGWKVYGWQTVWIS